MSSDLAGDAAAGRPPPAFRVKYMARDIKPEGDKLPTFLGTTSFLADPGSGANNASISEARWAFASGRKCGTSSSPSAFSEKPPAFLRRSSSSPPPRPSAGADCARP